MSCSRGGPRTCSGAPAAAGKSGFVVPALSPVCDPSRQVMASHSSIRGVSHMWQAGPLSRECALQPLASGWPGSSDLCVSRLPFPPELPR